MTNLHLNEQSIARFVPSPTPSTTPLHHHQSAMMPNHHQQHHHNINHNISLNHPSNHLLANQQTDAPLSHYSNNPSTSLLSSSSIAPPNPPINAARVLQRNLMYVVGLPSSLAKEEILKRKDYFGKFGKIVKIAISKKTVNNKEAGNAAGLGGGERALYSAYVTFKRPEDCSAAIRQINGCQLGGVIVRATYGTNKYCSFWLKGQQCNNGSCLYLHSSASDQECCSKDDLLLMDKLAKINVFVEPDDLMHGKMAINRLIHSLKKARASHDEELILQLIR